MRDNDDFSTILEAYKYKCPFDPQQQLKKFWCHFFRILALKEAKLCKVDNDNYRDWGVRIKDPEVAKWYGCSGFAYSFFRVSD